MKLNSPPIIFLDVDGVLNGYQFFRTRPDKLSDIDRVAVERLNTIIDKTGASVVLSSTWRYLHPLEEMQLVLENRGFRGKIIDYTPSYICAPNPMPNCPAGEKKIYFRGIEIMAWIDSKVAKSHLYKNFVILDDSGDMPYWFSDNFIQTNIEYGLSDEDVKRALEIFAISA